MGLQKQVKLNRIPVFNRWLEEKRVVREPELRGKQEFKTRAYVDEGVGNSKMPEQGLVSRGLKLVCDNSELLQVCGKNRN